MWPWTRLALGLLLLVVTAACGTTTIKPTPLPLPVAPEQPALEIIATETITAEMTRDAITIAAVGDIMGGTIYPHPDGRQLPPPDGRPAGLLSPLAALLGRADLALGNLEGVLAEPNAPRTRPKCDGLKPRCFAFRMPPTFATTIAAAGIDVLSLANNHARDFGPAGEAATREALAAAGLAWAGAPDEAARFEIRGQPVVVFATATQWHPGWDVNRPEALWPAIRKAKAEGALVILSFHAGGEGPDYVHVPPGRENFIGLNRGDVRAFAREAVAAGADLVVGHGPHVLRGLELIDERLIAYSLGNFFTWERFLLGGPRGVTAVLEVELARDGRFVRGRLHPAKQIDPGGPIPDSAGLAIDQIRELSLADFPESPLIIDNDGSLQVPKNKEIPGFPASDDPANEL